MNMKEFKLMQELSRHSLDRIDARYRVLVALLFLLLLGIAELFQPTVISRLCTIGALVYLFVQYHYYRCVQERIRGVRAKQVAHRLAGDTLP